MKSKTKKRTILSLISTACLSCVWAVTGVIVATNVLSTNAEEKVEISSLEEFLQFRDDVNGGDDYAGCTVTLTTNLDLSTVTDWTPIGNGERNGSTYTGNVFKGNFDGGDYTVSNLSVVSGTSSAAIGLFGVVDGGRVENLNLENVTVNASANKNAGAVIGLMVNSASVDNVEVGSGSVSAADGAGGIVGRMTISGTVTDCVNKANVSGAAAGGIVGKAYYTGVGLEMQISNCSNDGLITSTTAGCAGGVVGFSAANVFNCTNNGVITASVDAGISLGGVVGWQQMYGEIADNINNGSVTSDTSVTTAGGIVGWVNYQYAVDGTSAEYPNCEIISVTGNTNVASVQAKSSLGSGGIVGGAYNAVTITGNKNCAETITGSVFAAGILGNYQKQDSNGYGDALQLTVSDNVTTTVAENITANCTNVICYDNVNPHTDFTASNVVASAVAKIGAIGFVSVADALAAAQDGDRVSLLTDCSDVEATISKSVTLDLGENTITDAYIIVKKATVTVKNGSIKNVNEPYPLVVQDGGALTVEELNLEASKSDRAIWVRSGSSLIFNSGSVLATKGENNNKTGLIAAIYTDSNTNVTMNGGTITVDTPNNQAVGIYGNYTNANVTVNGGKISTSGKNYSYGINVDGDITVTGGEIVTNEKGYGYSSGIRYGYNYALYTALGDVTISGGEITTNGYSGYIVNVGRSYQSADQTITITGGEFANNLSEVEMTKGGHKAPALINEGSASNVEATITEGAFSGFSASLVKGDSVETSVSGGSFDVAINEEFLADGYQMQENDDGTYGIQEQPRGTLTAAYTSANTYWGECGGNAKESFAFKFYNDETYMGYTSLNNVGGIINGNVYVSWHIKLDTASNTDEYWDMAWEIAPTLAMQPNRVEQWVDGVKVAECAVQPNWADSLSPVVAAVADADGKILSYVNNVDGATLANAFKNATDGATIALLKDVELSELMKVTGKSLTLEGNGNGISGEGALWLLSGAYEIKNVVFEDITYMDGYGVLECTYATATVENCVFKNNNVKNVVALDCNANNDGNSNVTIDDCTFTGNTCSTSVINSAEGTTVVKNSAITANVAEIAVMYNSANCNVTGCYFNRNTLNGTNANKAVILTGPWVAGAYTINVTGNAFMGDEYVAVYVEDWSEQYGANASNDLNDNYWNGGSPNYVAENPDAVRLTTCYTGATYIDGELVLSEQITVSDEQSALGNIGIIRNIATTNAAGQARYQVVFLCGIDALQYKKVGFEITVDGVTKTLATSTVYTGFIAAGVSHKPDDFGTTSTYIFAVTINFPTEYASEAVEVRAFYESFDGSCTYGETKAWDYIYQE